MSYTTFGVSEKDNNDLKLLKQNYILYNVTAFGRSKVFDRFFREETYRAVFFC